VYSNATDLSLALGQNITTSGGYEKWAILGGFGRLNYAYKDRYLVEANGRYDGSSKFPSDQRYAFFLLYRRMAHQQGSVLESRSEVHIGHKDQGSYGSLGNGSISSYAFQELFKINQSGRVINGVRPKPNIQPKILGGSLLHVRPSVAHWVEWSSAAHAMITLPDWLI